MKPMFSYMGSKWLLSKKYGAPTTKTVVEPFSTIEYSDLASFCLARKGRITVCENQGASWLPFVPFSTVQATKVKNRKAISEEVVYQKFQ